MKHSAKITSPEKRSPTFLLAGLVVLVFLLASSLAIYFIDAQKIPILENDTAWLVSYFNENQASKLSEKQMGIIQNSAEITTAEATDAGVTVTLESVCGNGYNTCFKVSLDLPESSPTGQSLYFENQTLVIDTNAQLYNSNFRTENLEDEHPIDRHHSLFFYTGFGHYPDIDYAFNNGIVRSICLESLCIKGENGETLQRIEGRWEFDILFQDEGKAIELIQDPVKVNGVNFWYKSYYEVEASSFILTEFSAFCEFKTLHNPSEGPIDIRPVIIMKDGRTVFPTSSGSDGQYYHWYLRQPIALDEVAFVKLSDAVFLPVQAAKQ